MTWGESPKSTQQASATRTARKRLLIASSIGLMVSLPLVFFAKGLEGDMGCFMYWAKSMSSGGLLTAYDSWKPDSGFIYPPLGLYLCGLIGWLSSFAGPAHAERTAFLLLKLMPVVFHLAGGYILHLLSRKPDSRPGAWPVHYLLFLLNPAMILCTAMWGQWDSMLVFGLFAMCIALDQRRPTSAGMAIGATAMVKPHIAFAMPVAIYVIMRRHGFKGMLKSLITAAILFALVASPYILAGHGSNFARAFFGATSAHQLLQMNADNAWMLFTGVQKVLHISLPVRLATLMGLMVWLGLSGLLIARLRRCTTNATVIAALMLSLYAAFFVLAQMHERYLLPAVAFAALATAIDRRYRWIYGLATLCCCTNMWMVYAGIPDAESIMSATNVVKGLVAMLNGVTLIYGFRVFWGHTTVTKVPVDNEETGSAIHSKRSA